MTSGLLRYGAIMTSASGAIVYGDSRDHAALLYLTHFTPKLEAAIALIPRRGEARMLIGGGVEYAAGGKAADLHFSTRAVARRSKVHELIGRVVSPMRASFFLAAMPCPTTFVILWIRRSASALGLKTAMPLCRRT